MKGTCFPCSGHKIEKVVKVPLIEETPIEAESKEEKGPAPSQVNNPSFQIPQYNLIQNNNTNTPNDSSIQPNPLFIHNNHDKAFIK